MATATVSSSDNHVCYILSGTDEKEVESNFAERFELGMRQLVATKEKAESVTAILGELNHHVDYDAYHFCLNKVFEPILKDNEKTQEIYKQLWEKVSQITSQKIFTVFVGPTEEARLHPLLPGLKACIL